MTPLQPDVIVNGERIPSAAIAAEAQHHTAPDNKPGWAWQAAARALTVRALLLQGASQRGLTPAPEPRSPGKEETASEALIRAYLEAELMPEVITEAECRAAYAKRPAEAAALSYEDALRGIHEGLERAAWAAAARTLVGQLVASATIEGVTFPDPAQGAAGN